MTSCGGSASTGCSATPGSTEMRMFVRWPDDLDYVLGLQEASVVAMADGYAQRLG